MKLDIVFGGWLTAHNGASSVMRCLDDSKESFNNENIDLNLYSLDCWEPRNFQQSNETKRKSIVKSLIENLSIKSSIFSFLLIYLLNIRHSKRIVKYYKSTASSPDTILFHDIYTCYYFLKVNKGFIDRKNIIVVLHTNGETFSMLYRYYPRIKNSIFNVYLKHIENYVINNVGKIGFVSKSSRDLFLSNHDNVKKDNLFYIYNGIEDNYNKVCDHIGIDKIKLVFVGTINERKGQRLLIDAINDMPSCLRKLFDVTFVGDGPLKNSEEERVKKYGLDNIKFIGATNNVHSYLIKSDVLVLSSYDEGLPIAIIEAMRAGLPIISTNVGGIPEMIDNEINGYLIEPCENELKQALMSYAKLSREAKKKMSNESRKTFMHKFSIEKMINGYKDIVRGSNEKS
ncbi:glycosyltransferase family 4 protein [Photobacterium nomapromontoriensis]|uniref:glycosyltransferase family 4 protein n=1 Tax=Photobacterium nomapromontoriensis TaxID=2910237 RepID=UPI003D0C7B03